MQSNSARSDLSKMAHQVEEARAPTATEADQDLEADLIHLETASDVKEKEPPTEIQTGAIPKKTSGQENKIDRLKQYRDISIRQRNHGRTFPFIDEYLLSCNSSTMGKLTIALHQLIKMQTILQNTVKDYIVQDIRSKDKKLKMVYELKKVEKQMLALDATFTTENEKANMDE